MPSSNTGSWAPVTPADTGLPHPAVYLCADDITPRTALEFGAITVGSAMAGRPMPVLQGLAARIDGDDRVALLEVNTSPDPNSAILTATVTGTLAEGTLPVPAPQWAAQARHARILIVIVGPRKVGELHAASLAFQPEAAIGVVAQTVLA